jgi:hypothetical protein
MSAEGFGHSMPMALENDRFSAAGRALNVSRWGTLKWMLATPEEWPDMSMGSA